MRNAWWRRIAEVLAGRRLAASVQKHARAADDLDAVLKEILKQ